MAEVATLSLVIALALAEAVGGCPTAASSRG